MSIETRPLYQALRHPSLHALRTLPVGRVLRGAVLGLALSAAGVAATGCVPTISKQSGKEHLAAWSEAESHQHHGRLKEAATAYELAAEKAERRVDKDESLYRASRVYARMQQLDKALAICDELGSTEPIARRTLRARLDAARYRIILEQDVDKAERDLMAIITDFPDSAASRGALRILATRHVDDVENKEEALAWVENLLSETQGEEIAEALMSIQAELLLQLSRRHEAISIMERQVERYPYPQGRRWDDTLYRLSELAVEDKQPKQAIAYLTKMISVHEKSFIIGSYTRPMFSRAAIRIARIYRDELNDDKAAIAAYQHVREEFPRSLSVDDALAEEAELLLKNGQRDRGCELLREVLAKHDAGSARRRAEKRINEESCK